MSVEQAEGIRGHWVIRDGELLPLRACRPRRVHAVITDERDPFENPITGEMETSMSSYKRKLRDHRSEDAPNGYFIKGNERMQYEPPTRQERFEEIREDVKEAERQCKYGMNKSTSEEREIWATDNQAERKLKMEKMAADQARKK